MEENLMHSETPATHEMIYFLGRQSKHEAKATQEVLINNVEVQEWSSWDLNLVENLWVDTEEAVRSQSPWNQTPLKQFVKEEWESIALADRDPSRQTYGLWKTLKDASTK